MVQGQATKHASKRDARVEWEKLLQAYTNRQIVKRQARGKFRVQVKGGKQRMG